MRDLSDDELNKRMYEMHQALAELLPQFLAAAGLSDYIETLEIRPVFFSESPEEDLEAILLRNAEKVLC